MNHSPHALSEPRIARTSSRARATGTPHLPSEVSCREVVSTGGATGEPAGMPAGRLLFADGVPADERVKFASAHGLPGAATRFRPKSPLDAQDRDSVSIAKCAQPGELAKRKEQFSRGGWKSDRKLGESDHRYAVDVCASDLAGARKPAKKKKKSVAKRLRFESMLNSPPGFTTTTGRVRGSCFRRH